MNSGNGTIAISERRLENISATIDSIIDLDFVVSARKLTSFTGQIISTGTIIGNIARIMTRQCPGVCTALERARRIGPI